MCVVMLYLMADVCDVMNIDDSPVKDMCTHQSPSLLYLRVESRLERRCGETRHDQGWPGLDRTNNYIINSCNEHHDQETRTIKYRIGLVSSL